MSDRITEATYGKFRNMLGEEYRYDKIFCNLLDQGMSVDEAAAKAKELVKEPIQPL